METPNTLEIATLKARIAELEAMLAAVGAGGVQPLTKPAHDPLRDEFLELMKAVLRDHMAVHGVGDLEMQPVLFQVRAAISKATNQP